MAGDAKIAGSAMDALHVDRRVENPVVLEIAPQGPSLQFMQKVFAK